jgi:CHAD domain-containing protein
MEIEAKFVLPDRETMGRLESSHQLAGLTLSTSRTKNVVDVYVDTPQHQLFSAGYACRQRELDNQVLITLKSLDRGRGGVYRREELEVALPHAAPPAEWPASPVQTRVLEIVGDVPLAPWFELRQTRLVRQMFDGKRLVGELSLDDVCVTANGKTLTFFEVESELGEDGTSDDLTRIVASLKDEWRLSPEPRSKFERALKFLGAAPRRPRRQARRVSPSSAAPTAASSPAPPDRPGIRPDDSMAEAARKTLDLHLQRMLWLEEGVRAGQDREALHDMRVATRRMRASLQVFDGYIHRKTVKPFAQTLRRTGRILGAVRDMDVFVEKAEHYLESLPMERRSELDPLLNVWKEEYARAREQMIAFLDGDAYKRLKGDFAELLNRPGALERPMAEDKEPVPTRVPHVLPIILFQGLARVQAYEGELRRPDVPLVRYHQLRIASKSLRYTLEFFEEVLGPEAKAPIEQVKRLQDHLGNLQDAVVTGKILRDFLVWGTWGHDKSRRKPADAILAPGVALYLSVRQTEIENLLKTFPQVWSRIVDPEFRRRMVGLIGALQPPAETARAGTQTQRTSFA